MCVAYTAVPSSDPGVTVPNKVLVRERLGELAISASKCDQQDL